MSAINARTLTRVRPQVGIPAVEDWRNRAVCRDMASRIWDPWHPERSGASEDRARRRAAYADARDRCNQCPVIAECLADAIATGERDGMRGGLDPVERRALGGPVPIDGTACADQPGSHTGVRRHKRAKESLCPACQAFSNQYDRECRARRSAHLRALGGAA